MTLLPGRTTPMSTGSAFRLSAGVVRVLLALVALALCSAVTWLAVRRADGGLRAELLQQARLVAQALDTHRVRALSGSDADLTSPEYRQLKRQLIAIGQANPKCKWFYLMGRRPDGTVFFFVDSEPPGAEDPSPPGQVFEEVPADCRRVFDAKAEATVGPVSDRWGVWVTALVPLTDPESGALVAVLGMDVDVRLWRWDVAARAAPLAGLLLVLLIGAGAALVASRSTGASPTPIMRRLLPPLAAMVILLMAGTGALLWQQHRQRLAAEASADAADAAGDLRVALEQLAAVLTAYAQPIVTAPAAQEALRRGDAERLLATWKPVFEGLRRENQITHFYFLDRQRTCLLRLHQPERRGDRIERFTALAAERTGKTAAGIELGVLGTLTLRVVCPVFVGGTCVGYVELGREIEDVLRSLHTRSGNQLAVIIDKERLDRPAWEESMRLLGREADWDRLPDAALIYASQGRLPDAFLPLLAHGRAGGQAHAVLDREVSFDGRDWRVSLSSLQDASGATVGDLLVMRDSTAATAAFARLMALGGSAGAVLLALLLSFVYVLLRRTDAGIRAQQAALKESAESYRNQFALNSTPMLLIDPSDGVLIDANAAAVGFYGHPRERLLAMRISDINTQPAEAVQQTMASVTPGQGRRFTAQHRLADGTLRDVEVSSSRIQFGGRSVLHSIIQDITERRQAEAQVQTLLAESNVARRALLGILEDETRAKADLKRLATVVEQATETVLVTDLSGVIQYVNPALLAATGYRRDEVIGQRPRLLRGDRQDLVSYRECLQTIAAGRVWQGRVVARRKDGTQYIGEVTASPVLDAAGQITHYVAIGRDVTEHLRVSAQLQQAQKMETIGRLAGGVAHDFNNLLTGIMSYVELCRDELPPPHPVRAYLDEITSDAERSAGITRQLLAFARRQVIMPRLLDLNEALTGMLKMLRHLLGEDIRLTWQPGAALWKVKMDPSQIDQILANLTLNARDAIGGVGTLTIETRNATFDTADCAELTDAVPGEYVTLRVTDSGCGMDAETLKHLFEPFFTTKGVGEGTGLGLATVYGIVRQNNGFVKVSSEPGKGSTFSIFLPRVADDSVPAPAVVAPQECRGGTETVLLVEDEKSVRTSTRIFLAALGYTVLTAADPEEALRLAATQVGEIDLLITDVVMPGQSGPDLARRLTGLRPALKCLFMSGYTADTIAHLGILEQNLNFLPKPFRRDSLARKVREVLDGTPAVAPGVV